MQGSHAVALTGTQPGQGLTPRDVRGQRGGLGAGQGTPQSQSGGKFPPSAACPLRAKVFS